MKPAGKDKLVKEPDSATPSATNGSSTLLKPQSNPNELSPTSTPTQEPNANPVAELTPDLDVVAPMEATGDSVAVEEVAVVRLAMFADPFVWTVKTELASRFCNECLRAPQPGRKLSRCGGCRFAHFCDAVCQKAAWTTPGRHKSECPRLTKAFPNAPATSTLLFSRLIDTLLGLSIRSTTSQHEHPFSLTLRIFEDRRGDSHTGWRGAFLGDFDDELGQFTEAA